MSIFDRFNRKENQQEKEIFRDPPHEEFWRGFYEYLKEKNSTLRHFGSLTHRGQLYDLMRNGISYSGCDFGLMHFGINKNRFMARYIWLVGAFHPDGRWLSAKIRLKKDVSEDLFDILKRDIESIESHFENRHEFEWDAQPQYSIGVFRDGIDFKDKENWKELFEWLCVNLEKLEQVFMNRLALYFYEDILNKTFAEK